MLLVISVFTRLGVDRGHHVPTTRFIDPIGDCGGIGAQLGNDADPPPLKWSDLNYVF